MTGSPANKRNGMRATPFGAKRREIEKHEAIQALALEGTPEKFGLFDLHKVDWLHCVTPRTDKGSLRSGFPDYLIVGRDFLCFLEIKADIAKEKTASGKRYLGKLSDNQRTFHERLRAARADVMTAWLPGDLDAINEWLRGYTGIVVNVDGLAS